jgi:TP901 family phage tail tape measure protein
MSPFEQNDEFSSSSAAARSLVQRLQKSVARSEQFEKAAEEDRRLAARQKGAAAEEARAGTARESAGPLSEGESARLDEINAKLDERIALERRIIANQRAIEESSRRQLRAYESNPSFLPAAASRELSPLAGGGYGGGQPPRQPPRYFRQPEEPERPGQPPGGPLGLPPGQQPRALLPEKAASWYEDEAKSARAATSASSSFASSQEKLGPFIEHNGEYMRAANLEFTRFGALSGEWIGAAARGATTMEELGRQTTATIGKFGGWLAAGGLVFAALDAVRAIGKGAIESASGVNQLERVIKKPSSIDSSSLQKSFRQESQHFNLPIEDVTGAAYEMGKVFKTQNEALEASKAVLYSVKVGELDVATASRYLIAIINGFHLPANQLVGVFDQLNNAQNEFGISIADVEAGLAKASGSFNAATTKGSPIQKYHELLALITTAQKATGQTGQVVGTAIQRAPNFLRQDKNKEILKRYGIDAGGDLNDIIVQGFEKSQSLSGHKIAELASAIFGPQYGARIGTPLFQQFDLYKKVLAGTSPKASKGSGETELQTQLGSISERIAKIKTNLESLGSGLSESGFLNILGIGVESINQMLQLTNNVLEIFNKLPAPVKDTVAAIIEARIALAAIRKFNVGDSLFGGGSTEQARRFFNPKNASRIRLNELLLSEEDVVRDSGQRSGRSLRRVEENIPLRESHVDRSAQRVRNLEAEGLVAGDKEYDAAVTAQLDAERKLSVLRTQQAEEAERQLRLLQELAEIERVKAQAAAAQTEAQVEQVAFANGRLIPGNVNKGKALSATDMGKQVGIDESEVTGGQRPPIIAANAAKAETAAASTIASAEETAATGTRLGALASRGVAATTIATQTISRAGGLMAELGSGLLSAFGGPAGIALGGIVFLPEIIEGFGAISSWAEENIYGIHAAREEERAQAGSVHYTRAQLSRFRKEEEAQERAVQKAYKGGASPAELNDVAGEHPVNTPGGFGVYAHVYRKLEDAQKKALSETGRASFLQSDVLEHQIQSLGDISNKGGGHFQKALADARHNVRSGDLDDKTRKALMGELDKLESAGLNASGDITSFYKGFNALANKLLEARLQALGTLVGGGPAFSTRKDVHQFINLSVLGSLRDFGSSKAGIREKGVGIVEQLVETLNQNTQNELQENLTLARTQQDRYQAYSKFFARQRKNANELRANLTGRRGELNSKLAETEGNLHKLNAEGKGIAPTGADAKHHGLEGAPSSDQDIKNIEDLRQRRKEIERQLREAGKAQSFIEKKLAELNREQGQALLSERISVIGEQSQIKEASIGGEHPVAQAQAGLASAKRELSLVKSSKVASPEQERQAILAVLNAREAVRQAVKQQAEGLASAAEALAQARANGDPILEAQAELRKAQTDLSVATNQEDRENALAEIINARHKLESDQAEIIVGGIELEAARSQNPVTQARDAIRIAQEKLSTAHGTAARESALKELVEARHEYEETQTAVALSVIELDAASTENPVRQARDRLKAANVNVKASQGKGPVAENKAEAERREAARGVRESVASRAIENVEFDAAIGKITTDQEIAAYTRLLHTLKLGRDAKRSLIEKIHSLQEEASGSLELTVGNIALPTLYDIKRAVQGGIGGGNPQAGSYNDYSSQSNVYHIHGDQREIERALDNTVSRSTKASKRSAGVG